MLCGTLYVVFVSWPRCTLDSSYLYFTPDYLGSILVLHRCTKYDFKYYRKTEILKYLKLRKILIFSYKNKNSRRINIEPLTGRSSNKVLYNRITMMVLSWTVFKPSIFSFPFLPTVIHIIPKCISNMYLWPDFGKPTIYTQETLKIITSISSSLKYNFG